MEVKEVEMEIKEAVLSDTPRIVELLKASLGDELPVSEEIWRYKHLDNPFGKSIVLLAEENGTLAGVRAFMRWTWQKGTEKYSCLRAVDTATHPDFRGRGIFKKLTLRAVEIAQNSRDDFIFNTPNDQSRPGYLKMGWKPAGELLVGVKPAWSGFWKIWKDGSDFVSGDQADLSRLDLVLEKWNHDLVKKQEFFTPKSADYLHWRYQVNPLQHYKTHAEKDLFIASCLRSRKGIKELRIVELIGDGGQVGKKRMKQVIKQWSRDSGAQVITFSPVLPGLGFPVLEGAFGPILTVRNLNLPGQKEHLPLELKNWSYSLGDLELF